jgi:hypothetical protein
VIRIAISKAAFDAIAATMPPGSYESKTNAASERLIWLPAAVVDRLKALRGPGESFSGWRRRTQGTRARSPLISAGTLAPVQVGHAHEHQRYAAGHAQCGRKRGDIVNEMKAERHCQGK